VSATPRALTSVLRALVGVFLGLVIAGSAAAQSGHSHQPPSGHNPPPGAATADGQAPHQRMAAFQREIDEVLADGRGAGLAFAADQNGYPGPLHVLELTRELGITAEQEARMRALFETMLREARARAGRLAAAETRLARLFADRAADEGAVRAAVQEAEAARREVRLVHLLAHLQTHDVLTEAQRQKYHELRWGQVTAR
jgi:Spy/CpxP family protein refolding chaperone